MSPPLTWPPGFFDRRDPSDDADFYAAPRLVTHIDAGAIQAVSDLYAELGVPEGRVLDLMSSWVSHLPRQPDGGLVLLGMNAAELAANPMAEEYVLGDLNQNPELPFPDGSFDAVTCCVSIDYLVRPVEVLGEVARVLRPGGLVVLTFSNRCFPTKAIRGWLLTDDAQHLAIVEAYLEQAGGFGPVSAQRRTAQAAPGDPLYGVWARRLSASASDQTSPTTDGRRGFPGHALER
jgi:SAM-dependent methyltransferase